MPAPPAYLDECVDHHLVGALRERGFWATSVVDEGRASVGEEDDIHLAYATERGWVLITHNERHFRALHESYRRRGHPHGGIIILPQQSPFERLVIRAAMMLEWVGTLPEYRSALFKWGQLQELLEQGHELPGFGLEEARRALGR